MHIVQTSGGCIDTLLQAVNVNNNEPSAGFSGNNVCIGAQINFTDQSTSPVTLTNWLWHFGDGASTTVQSPAHTYTVAGNYNVMLTVTNNSGCVDSVTSTVSVYPLPPADAGLPQSICAGGSVVLTATGGVSYSWLPGGMIGSPITVTPAATQIYTVNVTDAHDCHANDNVTVTVHPNPVADAGISQIVCAGTSVHLSASGGGSYSWTPGGDTTQQITVVPASNTNYSVTVTNNFGCQSSDQVSVTVNALPVANAGPDRFVCFGEQLMLNGTGGGNYLWLPTGDTTSGFTFTPANTADYFLVVTNAAGCKDSDTVAVVVHPIPVTNFSSPPLICEGTTIHFTDLSFVSSGTISGWNWSFGDGSVSAIPNPVVLYHDTGSYDIQLVVTSSGGCKDTGTAIVIVAPEPVISFSLNDVCLHDAVNVVNNSSIISGETLNYQWDMGDSTVSYSSAPSHTYMNYGTYSVSVIVTSARGCRDSSVNPVTVHALPVAAFSNISVCENNPVYFHDSSFIAAGNISSWHWNFGDQIFSSLSNPSHVYTLVGLYPVQLNLLSDFGCRDSVVHIQRIFPNPVPDFSGENKCLGDSIHFQNQSLISSGSIVYWQWNFGDNSGDTVYAPVHLYTHPRHYNVQLSVISDSGCRASVILPSAAIVYPLPTASFVSNTTSVEEVYPYVAFYNQSTVTPFNIWNFGDGTTSSDFSPEHVFPQAGFYDIVLMVVDQYGCRDTTVSKIEVRPVTSLFVPNAFTPNGDGVNDTFHAYFVNMVKVFTQIFDRWGTKIYEWSDLSGSWNGMYDGRNSQSDVYVYRLEYTDIYGKTDVKIGHVTLVR
ncbi:MAG: PKD domain-containing protein [Bacteroidetes bacterium]|nr:PKD domain-containing protein [Bacteroidota bacterium]